MNDIILINKPRGITSFGVIHELRKILGIKKIGHAGTLDPLADGLLIVGIAQGTKKLASFVKLPKTYEAEILFGLKTETGDLEGKIIEKKATNKIDYRKLDSVLRELTGEIEMTVPIYSAIKINGKCLYRYARKGIKVELPKRMSTIFSLARLEDYFDSEFNCYNVKVKMECSSGTYVRSLVEEIGRKMNIPTTCQSIKRTKIGDFDLKDAVTLENIKKNWMN